MSDLTLQHRQELSALAHKTYFNYGGQGALPTQSLQAIQSAHELFQQAGPFSEQAKAWMIQETALTRQTIATELSAPPETIAFTENVSVGCNIPLWGIAWNAGDHILLSDCEHPGIIAAVQEIQKRHGVEVSSCPLMAIQDASHSVDVIAQHLQPRTRLVIVSHILWNTGLVLPLKDIVAVCHGHPNHPQILVDAAQSVGVLPLNLSDLGADFYAFTGHKWWCGPAGVGGLYIKPDVLDMLQPTFIGWRGITIDDSGQPTGWQPTAEKFEVATSGYPLYSGLRRSIQFHHQWGTAEQRYQRIVSLSRSLWQQLQDLPQVECLRSLPPEAGLVAFKLRDGTDGRSTSHRQLVQFLEQENILTRTLLHPDCVRACVHYFTMESELEQLVQAIKKFGKISHS